MSARFSRTLFASAARPAARAAGRNAGRRMMSSAHGAQAKSDTPWMIGSALVFGPLAIYLVTPSAKDKAHDAHEKALPKTKGTPDLAEAPAPAPSDEKTTDSPASEQTITDDEGNAASNADVADSINKAVDADSPKEAEAAEESSAKGTTQSHDAADSGEYKAKAATSNTEPEQDKTTKEQNTDSKGLGGKDPSDVGEARVKSADGKSPKESAKEDGEKH